MKTTITAPYASPDLGRSVRRFFRAVHPALGPLLELTGDRLVVGRAPGAGRLTVDDERVSREHFELVRISGDVETVRLRDLGGKNGTLLNGQLIETEYLHGSAVIRAGNTLFVYSEAVPPPGTPPPPEGDRSVALIWISYLARLAGPADLPVLITGPTGADKERLAQEIHEASARPGPLVAVNCATFNRALIASELFGHVRGAFSGADSARAGLFVTAQGGTLFLDEIGDLPLEEQAALLRALDTRRVRPVGSDRAFEADVRVIAATHLDLERKEAAGDFRTDLRARLAGLVIDLPGLCARREDILPLFKRFVGSVELTTDAAEALLAHEWPGNVRELQHAAASVRLFACSGRPLDLGVLPTSVQRSLRKRARESAAAAMDRDGLASLLQAHTGNVARMARSLGCSRQTLDRRLRAAGLDPKDFT